MFRKLLVSVIIATAIFAAGSSVYAQSNAGYDGDAPAIFELQTDREESKTFDSEYVVSGNAKEGTQFTIDIYWFKQSNEKSIINRNSAEDSDSTAVKEGKWILQQTDEFTIGASSIFADPVYLNFGRNKLVIYAKDIAGNDSQKIIEIERFLEEDVNKEVYGSTLNKFVEDITNSINQNK
jgi:lipopolysaccharide export LptBFGC system permease protein LptF